MFGIFVIMLVLNILTRYGTDDFAYMSSFYDGSKIENVLEIFPSMYSHAFSMNGRIVAHFIVQLSLLFPPIIFDLLNSGAFLAIVYIIYKYSGVKKEINNLSFVGIFMLLFCFIPDFGAVILWQDGAINYSWSVLFGLLYAYPIVSFYYNDFKFNSPISMVIYVIVGVLIGDLAEVSSFGIICLSVYLLVCKRLTTGKKNPIWSYSATVAMMIGYLFMLYCPATRRNKIGNVTLHNMMSNFVHAFNIFTERFWILIVVFIVLFIFAVFRKKDKKKLNVSFIFFIVSIVMNSMNIVAPYFTERNLIACSIFIIISVAILFRECLSDLKNQSYTVVAILSVYFILCFLNGFLDISEVYVADKKREIYAREEVAKGNMDLQLRVIKGKTKYSIKYSLKDLGVNVSEDWPNSDMAAYYGAHSICGYE